MAGWCPILQLPVLAFPSLCQLPHTLTGVSGVQFLLPGADLSSLILFIGMFLGEEAVKSVIFF